MNIVNKKNLHMIRILAAFLSVMFIMAFATACGSSKPPVELLDEPVIEYGESEYYSQEDMDACIAAIKETMGNWATQCNIQAIRFSGDEMSLKGLYYCNSMTEDTVKYAGGMMFYVDFVTPQDAKGFDKNTLYENWEWYIVKDDDGTWKFFNNGRGISETIEIPEDFDLTTLLETDSEDEAATETAAADELNTTAEITTNEAATTSEITAESVTTDKASEDSAVTAGSMDKSETESAED